MGEWAPVKFMGKKSTKYFLGEVLFVEEEKPITNCLRKWSLNDGSTTFRNPPYDDISSSDFKISESFRILENQVNARTLIPIY